jgi:hypothetical protein
MNLCRIQKAKRINGETLVLRDANVEDAAFILSLRTNHHKSRHLSTVVDDLDAQRIWLRRYEESDGEAYFIIENNHGTPLGTVRMYDMRGDSFCWGSWILQDEVPTVAAIESALIIYTYAIESGFVQSHFQVHKANERVWAFHERFGAERISEDGVQYEYILSNAAMHSAIKRYRRYLPNGILIEESIK